MKKTILICLLALPVLEAKSQTPCDKIETYADDVRPITEYSTPFNLDFGLNIWISKIREPNKKDKYYLNLREFEPVGKTVNGAFIVLENGKRISKPDQEITLDVNKEDVSPLHPGYIQQAQILLSVSDILILKTSPISKFAFSYLKGEDYKGTDLYQMFLCLLNK